MFTLKRLSKEGIPAALEKADKYRLLNEPREAESICLDVLDVDPNNQKALVNLLLARTDQFGYGVAPEEAREALARLSDDYKRAYYAGIILERQAKATMNKGMPGAKFDAYEWLEEAMDQFEKAERLRPSGNDETILRWNACARIIMKNKLAPRNEEGFVEPMLE
jgi:tetratricopeptide (TPR) repeat protein